MQAKKKPIDKFTPEELSVDVTPKIKTIKVTEPVNRSGGEILPDVATLVDKLKNEKKVI